MPIKGNFRYDLTGQRFGRLTVQGRSVRRDHGRTFWACVCDCGGEATVGQSDLRAGRSQSCGCLRREALSKLSAGWLVERGVRREYNIWTGIKSRTTDPLNPHYDRYGGRGIRMCDRWLHGEDEKRPFECFLEDITPLPRLGPSLDRIDNDGHYEPGNVRWATAKEQSFNRSDNVLLTANGKSQPLPQWCDELGLPYSRTYQRIANGWPISQALGLEARSGVLIGRPKGRKDSGPRKPRAVIAAK